MHATGDELMPIGPHAGKPMRALDLEYLERIIGYDSEWKNFRPMFMAEIERRRLEAMRKFSTTVSPDSQLDAKPAKIVSSADSETEYRTIRVKMPVALLIRARVEAARNDEHVTKTVIRALEKLCGN
jgi:hypothetical protein